MRCQGHILAQDQPSVTQNRPYLASVATLNFEGWSVHILTPHQELSHVQPSTHTRRGCRTFAGFGPFYVTHVSGQIKEQIDTP